MIWLRQQFEDYPRRFLVVAVSLTCALFFLLSQPAVVALADACGTAPDWWTLQYASYLACEAQNGGPATTVQAITSPMLNGIDTDINGMSGAITSALSPLSSLSGDITGAISNATALFVPQPGDGAAFATSVQGLAQHNTALAYVATLGSEMQAIQASVDGMGASVGSATPDGTVLPGTPVSYTDVYGFSHSAALGPLGTGVTYFLYGLDQLGWHPAQFRQFFDAWWAVTVVVAILRDFGVHFGSVPGALGDHRAFWGSSKDA